jgi:hypothetical protein
VGLVSISVGDIRIAKKRFRAEQIIGKLREAEVEISKGQTIGQVVKKAWDHGPVVLPLARWTGFVVLMI